MGKRKGATVNITVAVAVHPPQGEEQPEVSVEVGQAGFEIPTEDEEEDDEEDD